MGMRMQEVMYAAELLDVNAFDQPSVELYKDKTREILKL
jgi:glucose-6-phosphate isomerase